MLFWKKDKKTILRDELRQAVKACTGYGFRKKELLHQAMTHSSAREEGDEAEKHSGLPHINERLEFLGDAVLDFLVAAWLYDHFPEFDEGQMTRCRSALVGNDQLAEFARRMDLGKLMLLGRGEQNTGGRERSALLGSTFEALVGSLYLDQGIEAVIRFIVPFLDSVMGDILNERNERAKFF